MKLINDKKNKYFIINFEMFQENHFNLFLAINIRHLE